MTALDGARDDLLAAFADPLANAPRAIATVQVVADRASPVMLRMWTVVCPSWARVRAETVAWLRVAAAALAVAEFAAQEGRWPESLDPLVPSLLASVPVDPWSGGPLRYRPGVVWSVGRNGTDEGGVPPEDAEQDWDDDYVVALRAR